MYETYRYRWTGVNIQGLNQRLAPGLPASLLGTGPYVTVDLSADDSTKSDLDEVMSQLGYEFVATSPPVSPLPVTLRQVVCEQLTTDESTASPAFTTLLSANLVTDAGFLDIAATIVTNATATEGFVRLLLDGHPLPDGGAGHLIGLAGHSISKRIAVVAGVHTVDLQWRTKPLGTLEVRPVSFPDQEHATLIVRETT